MHFLPRATTVEGPADRSIGDVHDDVMAAGEIRSRIRVKIIRFAPAAPTPWHSHVQVQALHLPESLGLLPSRGGKVLEIRPGDTIYTPPGVSSAIHR